jgi:hypothetical protein
MKYIRHSINRTMVVALKRRTLIAVSSVMPACRAFGAVLSGTSTDIECID